MSYYEDFIEPYMGELDNYLEEQSRDYWITKDGRKLDISNMDRQHIINTIRRFGEDSVPHLMIIEAEKRNLNIG